MAHTDKAKLHIDHVTEMWAREKATRAEKLSAALAKAEAEAEQSSGTRGAVGDDDEEEKSEEKSEDEEEREEEEEREIDDDEPQEESDEARPRATTTRKVNAKKKAAKPKSATAEDEEGVRYVGASLFRDRGQSRAATHPMSVLSLPTGT